MHQEGVVLAPRDNAANEDIYHNHQAHADKQRAWTMSKSKSLRAWFMNQGLEHLWSDPAAAYEETLLLLASEKQWDDVRKICANQLNVPMAQIGCLKAYLINKLNSRAKSPKSVSFAALASKYASCLPSRVRIEQKNEVFHLFRFICLSILTLIIMTASLATDNLAFWSKQRSCSNTECSVDTSKGGCSGYCGDYHHTNDTYEHPPKCIAHGKCGWRTGKTSYTQPSDSDSNFCPSCQGDSCVYSNTMYDDWNRISWDPHNQNNGPRAGVDWDSVYNFENLCNSYGDEAACMAMRFGNVYIALTLCAIGFNVFTVCLMTSFYYKRPSSCYCNDICKWSLCGDKTWWGILHGLTVICNFSAVVIWMTAVVCDDADPNLETAFRNGTTNYAGFSLYGLMICVVINTITSGCLCGARRNDEQNDRQNKNHDEIELSSAKGNVGEGRSKELAQVQNEVVELQSDLLRNREPGMPVQLLPGIQEQPAVSQPNDNYTHQ